MPFVSEPFMASLTPDQRRSIAAIGYHPDTEDTLFIPNLDRYAGMYLLGVQGSGKTNLLLNLIVADINAGNSVVVADPHGDLIQNILSQVPDGRLKDTHLLDMEDEAYPFGVNIFSTGKLQSSLAQTQAVERLMHIFEVLWPDVLSQQNLPRYMRAAAITFLANPGTTLVDMQTFLQDQAYRNRLLANVADPTVRQFWHTQYDNLGPHEQYRRVQPLIGRLEALFMDRSLVRNIVGQRRTTINFRKAIEDRQIILIKLPTKTITQDARLIGTILLSQIHAAVFSFADVPEKQRPGVSLYVDEFQHFATSDFAELLTEGRKFGVRVTVAHQYRNQLPGFLRDSTMTARTKVCFQLTPEDGREMAHLFPSTEATVQPDDIETDPVNYLLHNPSNNPVVRLFTDMYLHPMREHRHRGGKIDVESYRYDYTTGRQLPNRQVADPTVRLNNLLYETMREGNPRLPLTPEIVQGFSVCGRGFYKQAVGMNVRDPLLWIDAKFPRHLVVQAADGSLRWTRPPEAGNEQMYHFVFHLRLVMQYLSENPIGKATTLSTAEVARILTSLPKRSAFVRSANTVGVVYTHNTAPGKTGNALYERIKGVLMQTRKTYCHPRNEVERWFMQVNSQAQTSVQPVQAVEIE